MPKQLNIFLSFIGIKDKSNYSISIEHVFYENKDIFAKINYIFVISILIYFFIWIF